jgi:MYXO-CTERM domain-containing protein
MRRIAVTLSLVPLALLAAAACKSDAEGNIASCGNIQVEASAKCEVQVQGGCEAACTPVTFVGECEGRCGADISADCQAQCTADCQGQCTADPGSFDCEASCQGSCEANCEGKCADSACAGNCAAACEGECSASCEGTPPSATCEAKCEAGCEGHCTVDVDVECHGSCHAELQGGCVVQCESPDGALFCDGQYVDAGDNLAECIAALNAYLEVEVSSNGSAACSGNSCEASGEASVSCAATPAPSRGIGGLVVALAALGTAAARRRRSR